MPFKSDFIDMGIVGAGLTLMILGSRLVREGTLQSALLVIGFLIVIGDTVLVEFTLELITRYYPYVRIELEPSGRVIHGFLEKAPETFQSTPTLNATRLVFHWLQKHPYYGRFKEIVIHHELDFSKRVIFGPGYAVFQGYAIRHAQVARLVCHEYPYTSDRWKDLSRPAFALAYAHGGDVNLIPLPMTTTFRAITDILKKHPEIIAGNPKISLEKLLSFGRHYEAMTFAYTEKNRESQFYRSELLRLTGGEESRDSQTKGLLSLQTDVTKRAWEFILSMHEVFGSIDSIVKHMKKPFQFLLNKWTAIFGLGVVAAVTTTFLVMNPDIRLALGIWLSQGMNRLVVIIIAGCTLGVTYLLYRRQSK